MRTTILELKPEDIVMNAPFEARASALGELITALARIEHPRTGTTWTPMHRTNHWLPTPNEPDRGNERAMAAYSAEMLEITRHEQTLTEAARRVRAMVPDLEAWLKDVNVVEDRLLISNLVEGDRPEAESYVRIHERFCRTCRELAGSLAFEV